MFELSQHTHTNAFESCHASELYTTYQTTPSFSRNQFHCSSFFVLVENTESNSKKYDDEKRQSCEKLQQRLLNESRKNGKKDKLGSEKVYEQQNIR